MEKFTHEGFRQYYVGSWILVDGVVWKVRDCGREEAILTRGATVLNVPLTQLDWNNVRIPVLGYRNLQGPGKGLVFFSRRIGRITYRGFSHQTVQPAGVRQVVTAIRALKLNEREYTTLIQRELTQDVAQALYFPEFVGLAAALKLLLSKPSTTGVALSPDLAVTFGESPKAHLVILWRQLPVAESSSGGVSWKLVDEEYKGTLTRSLGKLTYDHS